mmetsp:Transcript_28633/g.78652  ORF Transcript_28633/g.78652 Transcript_28633/m.78652 type:complete len:254 (-) Transcript_28633:239-1000(-)
MFGHFVGRSINIRNIHNMNQNFPLGNIGVHRTARPFTGANANGIITERCAFDIHANARELGEIATGIIIIIIFHVQKYLLAQLLVVGGRFQHGAWPRLHQGHFVIRPPTHLHQCGSRSVRCRRAIHGRQRSPHVDMQYELLGRIIVVVIIIVRNKALPHGETLQSSRNSSIRGGSCGCGFSLLVLLRARDKFLRFQIRPHTLIEHEPSAVDESDGIFSIVVIVVVVFHKRGGPTLEASSVLGVPRQEEGGHGS